MTQYLVYRVYSMTRNPDIMSWSCFTEAYFYSDISSTILGGIIKVKIAVWRLGFPDLMYSRMALC